MPIPNKSLLEFGIQNSSVSVFGIGIGQYRPFFGIGIDNPANESFMFFSSCIELRVKIEAVSLFRFGSGSKLFRSGWV